MEEGPAGATSTGTRELGEGRQEGADAVVGHVVWCCVLSVRVYLLPSFEVSI